MIIVVTNGLPLKRQPYHEAIKNDIHGRNQYLSCKRYCFCLCQYEIARTSCKRWSSRSVRVKIHGFFSCLERWCSAIAINATRPTRKARLKIFLEHRVAAKPACFVVFVNEKDDAASCSTLRLLENQIHQAYFVFWRNSNQNLITRKTEVRIWDKWLKWRRIFQMIKRSFFQLWKQLKVAQRCFNKLIGYEIGGIDQFIVS